ncbi:velvet factor-domain-containing protein [Zychaea mexicana]|uniref:velvet factor-domain-containing protein n=1 Tax=Zychaea mexicana TaxID=64656 RepID=UPI0022FEF489|nr:velvet factor-domain-containing protein [Zychaea mexicana]KAI9488402.1 velvet factor-domain-containing protein [Zychaea mexicana]
MMPYRVPPPLGLSRPSRSGTHYELVVVQQPIHARCCGFGEKDRRLIDPPIILQLFTVAPDGAMIKETNADSKLYVVHCDLYCEDKKEKRSVVYLPSSVPPDSKRKRVDDNNPVEEKIISLRQPKSVRNLTGSLTANASHLVNERNESGTYFVFHDLSVRTDGRFTLKFMFMDLAAGDPFTMSTTVSAEVFSVPFTVYTAKKFPGMTESTPLSRAFANQGVKIVTRKEHSYTRASDKYYKMPLSSVAANAVADAASSSSSSSNLGTDPGSRSQTSQDKQPVIERDKAALNLSIASITHPTNIEYYKQQPTTTITASFAATSSAADAPSFPPAPPPFSLSPSLVAAATTHGAHSNSNSNNNYAFLIPPLPSSSSAAPSSGTDKGRLAIANFLAHSTPP